MLSRVGDRERGHAEDDFAGDPQRLAARHEHGQLRRCTEELRRQRRARGEHVLAVVEDEEQLAAGEVARDGILEALVGKREHVESGGDGDRDRGRARRSELDERRTVRVEALHRPCELESEARLARAAGPAEREQPAPVKERGELGELVSTTDEGARVGGEAVLRAGRVGFLKRRFESVGKRFQSLPPVGGEVVVAVLRQELARVEPERGPQAGSRPGAKRRSGGRLEDIDVDLCVQHEQAVSRLDRPGAECAARDVDALVQVVGRGGGIELGPERIHHLLPVEPVAAREREQLHELARLAQPPGAVRDLGPAGRGGEPAEEPDRDLPHRPRMTPPAPDVNHPAGDRARRRARQTAGRSRVVTFHHGATRTGGRARRARRGIRLRRRGRGARRVRHRRAGHREDVARRAVPRRSPAGLPGARRRLRRPLDPEAPRPVPGLRRPRLARALARARHRRGAVRDPDAARRGARASAPADRSRARGRALGRRGDVRLPHGPRTPHRLTARAPRRHLPRRRGPARPSPPRCGRGRAGEPRGVPGAGAAHAPRGRLARRRPREQRLRGHARQPLLRHGAPCLLCRAGPPSVRRERRARSRRATRPPLARAARARVRGSEPRARLGARRPDVELARGGRGARAKRAPRGASPATSASATSSPAMRFPRA